MIVDVLLNDRHKVMHLGDHTTHRGIVFNLYGLVHTAYAQRLQGSLLILGAMNAAAGLLNLYCCHIRFRLLAVKHFRNAYATVLSHGASITHLGECVDGGLHEVVRVA